MFGDASDVVANLDTDDELLDLEFDEALEATENAAQSRKRQLAAAPSEEDSGVEEGDQSPPATDKREPVWMDEDDDSIQYVVELFFHCDVTYAIRS